MVKHRTITYQFQCVGFPPTLSNSATAGCLTIQLNSEVNYLKIVSDATG